MVHAPVRCVRGLALALLLVSGSQAALAANSHLPDARDAVAAADMAPPAMDAAVIPDLKPGDYIWTPDAAPAGGDVTVLVSIPLQLAWVYRGGTQIGVTTVSTGKVGHETPTGSFSILQKAVMHRSNLYNSAPMPYMQRLTWDGIALHAGQISGQPASHGCVRLPSAFAPLLYKATSLGATVVITAQAPVSNADALVMALGTLPAAPIEQAASPEFASDQPDTGGASSGGAEAGQPMTIANNAP
ncbi:L,D-transpeptidase family protein [Flavisphingomonas formosensis]|uniref:L,D-transpeptidase family protein n=1 Tax=Flavisphingomonas formosensis TaxID=861534 RepID=UPI0012FBDA35